MDVSLDDYISCNPALRAASVGLRTNYERVFHGSDEFTVVSHHYVCSEMHMDSDAENDITNTIASKNTNSVNEKSNVPLTNSFEEAYLSLDLNEEDEFDKWYEQLNGNLAKETTATTNEFSDSSTDNENKTKSNTNNTQAAYIEVPNKMNNFLNQPGFDLRQMVDRKDQLEQDFMPINCNNNSNNKRKQAQWDTNNNRFIQNNATYPNKRTINGHYGNSTNSFVNEGNLFSSGVQLWQNQQSCSPNTDNNNFGLNNNGHNANVINLFAGGRRSCSNSNGHHPKTCSPSTTNGNFDESLHAGCCSFHAAPTHINLCQGCLHNKSTMIENELNFNMNGAVNQMGGCRFGCGAFGNNCTGAFNSSVGLTSTSYNGDRCSFHNISYAFPNNAGCCAGNSNARPHHHENISSKNSNMDRGYTQIRCHANIENNGTMLNASIGSEYNYQRSMNVTDVNKEDPNNGNNKNTVERKNIATMLGLTPQDLAIDSVPAMLSMMQEILKTGVTTKMFSKKRNLSE